MNVNNSLQGLQSIFSGSEVTRAQPSAQKAAESATGSADNATLSAAATLALQSGPDADVRMDKVSQVQQALAAGTYNVPSSDVADKMIQNMLEK